MMGSTAAVAAIAPQNAGSLSSLVAHAAQQEHIPVVVEKHHGFAEKLHGLTERLHSFGHHRTDSESSSRRAGKLYLC